MKIDDRQVQQGISEESVLEYLNTTPLFFERNLDVLESIVIPQKNGSVVSLVERQVSALRKKNTTLENQLTSLIERVEVNQKLSEKVRAIILRLLKTSKVRDCLVTFEQFVVEDFAAAEAGVFVFKDGANMDILERVKIDDLTAVGLFGEGQKPVLGPISNEQRETLFGSRQGDNSAVILPMIGSGWYGSVVMVSDDPSRYESDMASDFLEYLGQVIVLIINRALDTSSLESND
tara:strand:- start:544 stop:1245 length:702 start_codon:yes stop_codon:yes gene_type:complete